MSMSNGSDFLISGGEVHMNSPVESDFYDSDYENLSSMPDHGGSQR